MISHTFASDLDAQLLAYWLDELEEGDAAQVEEHLFACAECTARLRRLLDLRSAVKGALATSQFATAVTPAFIDKLRNSGVRLREYTVEPGGSTFCTMAPQDDFVVSHLRAPLAGVEQVDLIFADEGAEHRVAHLPFNAQTGEVTVIPPVALLRSLGSATQRMRLLAVTPSSEQVIGEYTFNHEPWPGSGRGGPVRP